jgi:hypothetical protein
MLLGIVLLGVIALTTLYYFFKVETKKSKKSRSRVRHIKKLPGPPTFNWFLGNIYPLQDSPGTTILCC